MTNTTNIAGRDGFILAKALSFAIVAIERLPEEWQSRSDAADMQILLETISNNRADHWLAMARGTLERRGVTLENGQLVPAKRDAEDNIVKL